MDQTFGSDVGLLAIPGAILPPILLYFGLEDACYVLIYPCYTLSILDLRMPVMYSSTPAIHWVFWTWGCLLCTHLPLLYTEYFGLEDACCVLIYPCYTLSILDLRMPVMYSSTPAIHWVFWTWGCLLCTHLPKLSHKFSIGLKSGLHAG